MRGRWKWFSGKLRENFLHCLTQLTSTQFFIWCSKLWWTLFCFVPFYVISQQLLIEIRIKREFVKWNEETTPLSHRPTLTLKQRLWYMTMAFPFNGIPFIRLCLFVWTLKWCPTNFRTMWVWVNSQEDRIAWWWWYIHIIEEEVLNFKSILFNETI